MNSSSAHLEIISSHTKIKTCHLSMFFRPSQTNNCTFMILTVTIFPARVKKLSPNQNPTTTYLIMEHRLQNNPAQCTHCRQQSSHVLRSQKAQITRKPHFERRQLWHLKVSSTGKVLFWTAWAFLSRSEPSFINSRVLAASKGIIVSRNSAKLTSFENTYRKCCPYCSPFRSEKHWCRS